MNDTDAIRRLMMAVQRLEDAADKQTRQMAEGLQQARMANAELAAVREAEEAKLKEAMVRLFQDQQQKTEAALRPVIGKAGRASLPWRLVLSCCTWAFCCCSTTNTNG